MKRTEEENPPADVAARGVRACPGSGDVWSRQLLLMVGCEIDFSTDMQEGANDIPNIDTSVEKAKGLIVGNKQPVTSLVEVLVTHASILHRRYRELEANTEHPVFLNLVAASDLLLECELCGRL